MRCNQKHLVSHQGAAAGKVRRGACAEPQMSVQLFYVILLIQDRRDLTVPERAKPEQSGPICDGGFCIHI